MSLQYYRIKNSHTLPCLFLDRNGGAVIFKKAPDDSKYRIFKMYREFEPDKHFQGLPPAEPAMKAFTLISMKIFSVSQEPVTGPLRHGSNLIFG